jgi:hypothetical protein
MISLTARGIETLVNFRLSNCITLYCCVKTQHANILLQQPWWTGYQGRNFGYGLLLSRLPRGNYGFVYGTSALLGKFICNHECKVIVYSLFPN